MHNLFSSVITGTITPGIFLICTAASILLGAIIAFAYTRSKKYSQSLVVALVLLPAVVQTVIMLVNGNIGAGVAVAGAFSLVRFRSLPGNARDINSIFLTMAVGLATGMGYLGIAAMATVILCIVMVVLMQLHIGEPKAGEKELKITIPESLDYDDVFADIFETYTNSCELMTVKTSNMGSLYKLHYHIQLKPHVKEKELIDKIRCRNGNLEIMCGRIPQIEQL